MTKFAVVIGLKAAPHCNQFFAVIAATSALNRLIYKYE